ncbi:MAG TPA: DUF1549 domain-containing protein, partial [Candidatus Saccharimonadales bacterium]|nr:DUF1549 domain-containing protein [Candidatus Saccharimonadales bacterium]
MMPQPLMAVMTLAFSTLVFPLLADPSPRPSAKKKGFDLEERKQQQPWLWTVPVRQTIPLVKNPRWALSQIDSFILRRLEDAGLEPAPAADARTWLRRVHFALLGLPPSREDIQEFLADTKPGARERVVDRLLASPHFGERWARHWMDLMRYAESRGHEGDYLIANAWRYRDYLIRAFNENVPYDQFLLEHLAGDLLPSPRLRPGTEVTESVLGTGWAFLGEENHSPVDIRQDECERIDNKVDVFSKTFLGLTVSCARCHDHKFDPIRAQDYYALSGFMLGSNYRQVRFEAMENNRKMAAELSSLREEYATRLAKLVGGSLAEGVSQISRYMLAAQKMIVSGESNALALASFAQEQSLDEQRLRVWIAHLNSAATNSTSPLHLFARVALKPGADQVGRFAELVSSNQLAKPIALPPDARVIADFSEPGRQPWKVDGPAFGLRPQFPGDILLGKDPANPIERIVTYGAARRDLFWNHLKAAPVNENDSGTLAATSRSGRMLSTPTVTLGVGKLHYLIQGKTRVYAGVDSHLMVEGPLHGRLVQVFDSGLKQEPRWVTHDLTPYSGHRVHVEFGPEGDGELSVLMVVEAAETPRWRPEPGSVSPSNEIRSLAEYSTELQTAVIAACKQLAFGSIKTSPDAALANWLVQNPALFRDGPEPRVAEVGSHFLAAQSNIASRVRWESHTAVAWFDGTGVDENILVRGKPTKIGALAPRSLPAAFASAKPITTGLSSGRYELAQQLVDPA